MKLIRFILAATAVSATALTAGAVKAYQGVIAMTCADGSTIRVVQHGDEAFHFTTTEDGLLLHEDNGVFTYGRVDESGMIVSTGVRAHDVSSRPVDEAKIATPIEDVDIPALERKRNAAQRRAESYMPYGSMVGHSGLRPAKINNNGTSAALKSRAAATHAFPRRAPQTGVGLKSSTYPTTGAPKGLIILVQYNDVKFTHPDPAQYFGDMINKHGFNEYGATGSALDYFTEQSGGQFTPSFDVLGPVTLSKNMVAYGGNDSSGDDIDARGMVVEACRMLDATTDFRQYDTDGDGEIDNVFVFYAGMSEAAGGGANAIWPHSWDVRGAYTQYLDGKILGHYACSNEWQAYNNKPDGIGTFCHEFSHVMGLPDLYGTYGANVTCTPGNYSLMDHGSYNNTSMTPPNYSAYEKNALGWFEPIMLTGAETVTLEPISSGQFGLIPTAKNTEFFLFENRRKTGWDAYIPNHGLLIWHIDYDATTFNNNRVNNTASHQRVDIEEANGKPSSTYADGWPFPGTTGKTEFTSSTSPALKTWAGTSIDLPVTDITENPDGTITFDVAGGGVRLLTPEPSVDEIGNHDLHFVARWPEVDGATDYLVTVYANQEDYTETSKADFDIDNYLPQGWTTTCTTIYDVTIDDTNKTKMLGFTEDGQYLLSPDFNADISDLKFYFQGEGKNMSSKFYVDFGSGNQFGSSRYFQLKNDNYGGNVHFDSSIIGSGVTQIRFRLVKSVGDVILDDIEISYRKKDNVLPDYNGASTGGKNELRIDKLPLGHPKYYFTVQAVNGDRTSRASEPIHVFLLGQTGVDDIKTDSPVNTDTPVRYFNLQGVEVANPAPGSIYIRLQDGRATKVRL